jgi:Arc/MetJ-type ribon-helix-helix transcriptional regulator
MERKNKTIGTTVAPQLVKEIEVRVEKGLYKTKSDFVHQAIIEKLKRER